LDLLEDFGLENDLWCLGILHFLKEDYEPPGHTYHLEGDIRIGLLVLCYKDTRLSLGRLYL
jgi:hypothetical protein